MVTLLGQYLAAAEPKLVTGLTLYGPILVPPEAARVGLKVRADTVRRNGMAGTADTVARSSLSPATRRGNPAAVAFVRESLLRQDPVGRSEEHTSELQSLMRISYAVFCLKKTKKQTK